MNIDDYREMVAKEKEESKEDQPQVKEEKKVETPEKVETSTETNTKPPTETNEEQIKEEDKVDDKPEPVKSDKIVIDGVGEVTLDDVKEWQKGYLRQQDYTRKTQEVSNQRKEAEEALQLYNYLKANPHIAEDMLRKEQEANGNTGNLKNVDPSQARVSQMEQKMYDMMLQLEIRDLQDKYGNDFEVREVLSYAQKEGIDDLDKAYRFNKAEKGLTNQSQETKSEEAKQETVNPDELKKQLRAELLAELEQERESTQTIISSSDSKPPTQTNDPVLTDQEKRMAQNFNMKPEEYAKWRDKK
jgi:uncharacterized protein YneF (UPF0154 family)